MHGNNPQFRTYGKLSYERCADEFPKMCNKFGEWNISTVDDARTNYRIVKRGIAYALKMYRTDIITWYPDGSIEYRDYNSSVTRMVMSKFGPLQAWYAGTNCKWLHKVRMGSWHRNYPFCQNGSTMTILPNGTISGLYDEIHCVNPAFRAERRAMLKTYRERALPRFLLGEFGNLFAVNTSERRPFGRSHTGWFSAVPSGYGAQRALFDMFCRRAKHSDIMGYVNQFIFVPRSTAKSREDALVKACTQIGRAGMDIEEHMYTERTEYPTISIRDL
jgi:hypothetical protein